MQRQGVKVATLENRPVPLLGLDVYFKAYSELGYGSQNGYISWASIANWCKTHQICDIDEIDYVVRHIRALEKKDHELLDKKKVSKS